MEHWRAFGRYHTGAQGLTERLLSCRSHALPRPRAYRRPNITKKLTHNPPEDMGTTLVSTFLSKDGLPFGRQSGASPALPPCTPFGNPPVIQTTADAELLAQITSLRKEMAKLQEHNNLLSSKVDKTQQLLHQQHTQNI
ncbi:unnamed protein product [Prunus brigantina]